MITLQKTLKNLKDNHKRCMDRRKVLTRSGAAYASLPTCKYFAEMHFLIEKTVNYPTETNIIGVETTVGVNQSASPHACVPLSPAASNCSSLSSPSSQPSTTDPFAFAGPPAAPFFSPPQSKKRRQENYTRWRIILETNATNGSANPSVLRETCRSFYN